MTHRDLSEADFDLYKIGQLERPSILGKYFTTSIKFETVLATKYKVIPLEYGVVLKVSNFLRAKPEHYYKTKF